MFLYENLSDEDRLQEDRVRSGHQAYEVMVMKICQTAGVDLTEKEIKYWGWKLHRSFGFMGGVQYMAAREKFPVVGSGLGVLFGIGFFLAADEIMLAIAQATPGPMAFNWKAHARGAIARIAYGMAAELTAKNIR